MLKKVGSYLLSETMKLASNFYSWLKGVMDWTLLINSIKEVFWLSLLSIAPILACIMISSFANNSLSIALDKNIIPGEIVAYSLSFISPTLYLFIKTHGHGYKLPLIKFVSLLTLLIYSFTVILYVIAKQNIIPGIDMQPQKGNLFYNFSLIFFAVSTVIWIYTTYHDEAFFQFETNLRQGEAKSISAFKASLNQQQNH